METMLNPKDAALIIRSAMRNLREQEITEDIYREAMAYVRSRTSEQDFNTAKLCAIANDR